MSRLGTRISRLKFMNNERRMALIIFPIGCIVRLIPELFAYPFPIGYDVINYYIPMVTNFDKHWIDDLFTIPIVCVISSSDKNRNGVFRRILLS